MRELVLGTLRWLRRIDGVIEEAARRPVDKVDSALLAPLRLGVYQLLFLDRIPAHAAVDEAVREANRRSHRGGSGFVNAVLRKVAQRPRLEDWPVKESNPLRRMAIEHSHPDLLVKRWTDQLGEEAALRVMEANNRPHGMHLLTFSDRLDRDEMARRLAESGNTTEPSLLAPNGLRSIEGHPIDSASFAAGDLYIQDEASQVAALIPMPVAGERVLDVAAAPGGKAFALLATQPEAKVVAADCSFGRTLRLRENCRRLRRPLPLLVQDANHPAVVGEFDRVIVDLPCSGTGTLRKSPELKWRITKAEIDRLSSEGLGLALASADRVAPGGLLCLVTCSLEPEENEGVVQRLLLKRRDFAPFDLVGRVPPAVADAVVGPGLWRLWTGGDHDGFTVQVLQRANPRP